MDRVLFVLGCVFAFLGVAAGAFGAHALEQRVPADRLSTFEIGARYQMYHAFALLAVAWAASRWPRGAWRLCALLFVGGILVFSGTLYGIGLGGPRWLGAITPIGGAWLLAGWAVAGLSVWRRR
jgi:uncharacterized membrane protein YgdD (TMEM256/DUF423 family)